MTLRVGKYVKYSFNKWPDAGLWLVKEDFNKRVFLRLTEFFRTAIVTVSRKTIFLSHSQFCHSTWLIPVEIH